MPDISPMLARAVATIPVGDYAYEPKWDGFRCIIVRDGDSVELASRGKKPLTRYFPEMVEAAGALPECIVDGELIVATGDRGAARLSWELLSQRIHPAASRVAKLSVETPAQFVAFDLLRIGDEDLTGQPFTTRRARLEQLFDDVDHPELHLSVLTRDADLANDWFTRFEGAGLDGVIAKPLHGTYQYGKRDMLKIKHKRTADAVVVGYRVAKSGHGVGSILLGLHDDNGTLVRVGGIVGLPAKTRDELVDVLAPLVIDDPAPSLETPPSRFGGEKDTVWLEPELVVEVAFDQMEGNRFRHAVTLLRWRPDKDARDCTLDQVERAVSYDLDEVLSS